VWRYITVFILLWLINIYYAFIICYCVFREVLIWKTPDLHMDVKCFLRNIVEVHERMYSI